MLGQSRLLVCRVGGEQERECGGDRGEDGCTRERKVMGGGY
jgi:hypothetical protein